MRGVGIWIRGLFIDGLEGRSERDAEFLSLNSRLRFGEGVGC